MHIVGFFGDIKSAVSNVARSVLSEEFLEKKTLEYMDELSLNLTNFLNNMHKFYNTDLRTAGLNLAEAKKELENLKSGLKGIKEYSHLSIEARRELRILLMQEGPDAKDAQGNFLDVALSL